MPLDRPRLRGSPMPHYRPIGPTHFPASDRRREGDRPVAPRANANQLRLAADRTGGVGASVAGYGVSMLGTTGSGDGFDPPASIRRPQGYRRWLRWGPPSICPASKWSFVEGGCTGYHFSENPSRRILGCMPGRLQAIRYLGRPSVPAHPLGRIPPSRSPGRRVFAAHTPPGRGGGRTGGRGRGETRLGWGATESDYVDRVNSFLDKRTCGK